MINNFRNARERELKLETKKQSRLNLTDLHACIIK